MAEAKTTKPTLKSDIFGVEVKNHQLLKTAYEAYLAEARSVSAVTKRRGEISGGGKKPWKQKGTGRARVGSSRNPIWRGGGVVFGPLGNENYLKKLSKNAKRTAIRQALSLAKADKRIDVIDFKFTGKTKDAVKFLDKHSLKRRVLLVVDEKTPELIRSVNNLPQVELISARYLTVYQILNADHIVLTEKALAVVNTWLGEKK